MKAQTSITIGKNLLDELRNFVEGRGFSSAIIVTDQKVYDLFAGKIEKSLSRLPVKTIIIPNGEKAKEWNVVKNCLLTMTQNHFDRKSVIIAVGGGTVSDVAGFIASIYLRGIDWIVYPTTLLSQVDASIGGKTGINFGGIKNVVGNFHQPKAVFIDTNCLHSLPEREFCSGLTEVIKYGLIADPEIISILENNSITSRSKELEDLISRSVKIKLDIVKEDERDTKGKRAILNFGHTLGHAIESVAGLGNYTHGEAISIGMVFAIRLSNATGLCNKDLVDRVENIFKKYQLPTSIDNLDKNQLLEKILSDKKTIRGQTQWILLDHIAKPVIGQKISEQVLKTTLI